MVPLKNIFGRKQRPRLIPIDHFLKMRPVRNPHLRWNETEDGKVVITMLVRRKGFARVTDNSPKEVRVELDRIGSFLWSKFDGQHTAQDLLEEIEKKFRIFRQEAELSLSKYLQDMAGRRLIGFISPSTSEK